MHRTRFRTLGLGAGLMLLGGLGWGLPAVKAVTPPPPPPQVTYKAATPLTVPGPCSQAAATPQTNPPTACADDVVVSVITGSDGTRFVVSVGATEHHTMALAPGLTLQ